MAERVTMQTIADAVGVGKMSVSNAYSRPRHVSAALRERIFAVADELGYAGPDASGRALARRRTGLVGVLLTSSPDEAFENLVALGFVSAVARALTPRSLSLALLSGHEQDDLVPALDIAMDGLVVYSCLSDDDETRRTLMKRRLPMVLVDQP
ncbi:MAG TPA: LacI family DNA-binding transcriptional regulator, partial [Solirubrobacteraceae bacterium]|nr:LacI family DNA-binding transcriptional regulator [Solirubrobacteraceae bacterium]